MKEFSDRDAGTLRQECRNHFAWMWEPSGSEHEPSGREALIWALIKQWFEPGTSNMIKVMGYGQILERF